MARRRYLIAYDIANPKRLQRVIKLMEGHGTRLQYSVFLCDLSRAELALWRLQIEELIDLTDDSVIRIDLGFPHDEVVSVIGRRRRFPPSGPMIV